ncbi:MAG TPA: malectin domain-containing carbohydrate-binding protein, partial [Bryobacteraceae bacterium]|nr:malectin domain-containing carbohydrate-binding protein [Bryobacteraceae bacterium]
MRCLTLSVFAIFCGSLIEAQTVHSIAGCQILPANNVWNTRVDTLPLDPNSDTYVANIGPSANLFPDFWSIPGGMFLNVVSAGQPRVPVTVDQSTIADPGPYPIPPNAVVQQATDGHLIVLDSGNCKVYEMYQAIPQSDGSWSVGTAATFDLSSNVARPTGWFSANAAGVAFLPGMVSYDEVMSGQITHAIGMTVPYSQQYSYIWPARMWASLYSSSAYPHFGQRFRLKAGFDVSPYPFEVQVILNALKKYGAIVDDNGAPWFLNGFSDPRWNNDNLHTITQVLGSNMEAVDESGLQVEPNSQVAAGSPLALDSIYLDQRQVSPGASVNAEAILTAPAPAGGATVALSLSSPGVLGIPASVAIPAGVVSAPIPITVNSIGLTTPVTIVGTYGGATVQSPVLLVSGTTGSLAPRLSTFTSSSGAVTVTLTGAAVAGGTAVSLTSSNPAVQPVPATVAVPAGGTTATLALPAASASTTVNITATLYGESLTIPVTTTQGTVPAPPPPPPPPPPPSAAPALLLNAGGPAYTDGSGNTWAGDYGYSGGNTAQTSSNIAGTNSPALYQTCRWGAFGYNLTVPNGSYTVTLKFAEIYYTTAGSRVFNV